MEKLTKEAKEVFDEFMNGYHWAGEDYKQRNRRDR